jgi:hypothetical protein
VPDGVVGYVTEPNATDIADHLVQFYTEHTEFLFSQNIKQEKLKYSWKAMVERIKEVAEI